MKWDSERIKEVFSLALQQKSPAEREHFLAETCQGQPELREQVESLLRAHGQAGDFLGCTISLPEAAFVTERPGMTIGRYKLLELIGEGGCGSVWMAEQEEPVRRRVALKVIKPGMDTRQVVARFDSERQALALMDHPSIARVFDGGATDTGRPYFVMELVRGMRITDYCDANKLSMRDRLGLFAQVCQAVQHAHQKGIIHRDLKPSNILVTEVDGAPVPKVIDFGVAKATQARLTEMTFFTGLHQMIGTPAYMSPEQAGLGALDMDTRSDIYSLGVLLYELLTGQTPLTKKQFEKAGLDEIFRLIREQDPPKPSTRLSSLTREQLTAIATQRQAEPVKLNRLVHGELDWIVMKALEKNRRRRYETANGLAMDIQRYLQHEPVLACPPGNLYRFEKMVQRNKAACIAAAAVVASLLVGLGLSTWLYVREKAARQEVLAAQRSEAQLRTETEAIRKIAGTRASQLLETVKLLNLSRTNLDQAETYYRQTLQLQREMIGSDSPDVAATLLGLSEVFQEEGKLPEAEKTQREAVELEKKLAAPDDTQLIVSLGNLGLMLQRDNKSAEAEPVFREALGLLRRQAATGPAGEYSSMGVVLHHLAMVLREQKELAQARVLAEEAAALYRRHPDWPPGERQHSLQVLGDILEDLHATDYGALASFESLYRDRLAEDQKRWPDEPAQWRTNIYYLVSVLHDEHKDADMDHLFDDILARPNVSQSRRLELLSFRADLHARSGRFQAAASDLARVIDIDPTTHWNWYVLAPLLIQSGDIADYQGRCKTMLNRFGDTTNSTETGQAMIAERVAKSCLLFPSGVGPEDLTRAANLADSALTLGKGSLWFHWFQFTKGLAEYRQGHFAGAIEGMQLAQEELANSRDAAQDMCKADTYFVSAMAQHQLHQPTDAQAALARGVEIVQAKLPNLEGGDLGQSWYDVLMTYILMREAKQLIEGNPTAEQK